MFGWLAACAGLVALSPTAWSRAVDSVDRWHAATSTQISVDLDLQQVESGDARVRCWQGPQRNVAWCSAMAVGGPDDENLTRAITVWNAPSIEVPHFHMRVGIEKGASAVELEIDFRHRLACGYELASDDGSHAAPANREEFAMASLRSTYDDLYFTPSARAWHASVLALEGAEPGNAWSARSRVEGRRQFGGVVNEPCSGPLLLSTRLSLSQFGATVAACDAACERWLGWMENPAEVINLSPLHDVMQHRLSSIGMAMRQHTTDTTVPSLHLAPAHF